MEPFSMFASQRRAIILNKHNYCSQSRFTRTEKNGIEIALYGIMKSSESEHYELLQLERSILFSRLFFSFFFSNLLVKMRQLYPKQTIVKRQRPGKNHTSWESLKTQCLRRVEKFTTDSSPSCRSTFSSMIHPLLFDRVMTSSNTFFHKIANKREEWLISL